MLDDIRTGPLAARISPWYYFSATNPLVNGIAVSDAAVLAVGSVILAAIAVVLHRRRDLRG